MTRLVPHGPARLLVTPIALLALVGVSWVVFLSLEPQPTDSFILNRAFVQHEFIRHVEIVGVSFGLAAVIGLPLGVIAARSGVLLRTPILLLANLGQAVPSIGVLILFYTVFGLGVTTACVALVLYGLLPVLRNTMVGLESVDAAAVEAARGMGMTSLQSLRRVELPLAAPVIFAGLRTALVLIVATATLANFIGAGGLGDVIASGINQSDRIVFAGAVIVAVLALTCDWALGLIEFTLSPRLQSASAARRHPILEDATT